MAKYDNKGRGSAKLGSQVKVTFTFWFRPVFVLFVNKLNLLDSKEDKNWTVFTLTGEATLRWVVAPTGSENSNGLYQVKIEVDGKELETIKNSQQSGDESRQEFIIECQVEGGETECPE